MSTTALEGTLHVKQTNSTKIRNFFAGLHTFFYQCHSNSAGHTDMDPQELGRLYNYSLLICRPQRTSSTHNLAICCGDRCVISCCILLVGLQAVVQSLSQCRISDTVRILLLAAFGHKTVMEAIFVSIV